MAILEKKKQYTSAMECLDTEKFKDFYMRQNETVRNPNYTPVFRRDVLWYGAVRPSVRPFVRPSDC